jgi:hypothetical protein
LRKFQAQKSPPRFYARRAFSKVGQSNFSGLKSWTRPTFIILPQGPKAPRPQGRPKALHYSPLSVKPCTKA